ncbi:MAG: alpha-hydroxy-acid oxidizing protein [Acidisphaera sp.]|nr:alpha-hydroxy-acid oxidizing protein [Acidisphaera sp.]
MPDLAKALSIGDLRRLARRRLPRFLFEIIESGVEDERSLERNELAFARHRLLPRYLVDVSRRDQSALLLGRRYAAPFGIAPTGFAGLLRRGAEVAMARAAAASDIPFVLSGASIAAMETIAAAAPHHAWYHLYPARDASVTQELLRRAEAAGFETLVLTVDNPVFPKRERDTRNGFKHPMTLSPFMVADALAHPAWLLEYLRHGGMPRMENWARFLPEGASSDDVATFFRSQSPSVQTWRDLDRLRAAWPGRLILKGIQHPADAALAVQAGVDGIVVSNHGGKSFDPLPSPLETLPGVVRVVGGRLPVMLDSGIRRGSDIVIARCLGASFAFVGRAALYGVVAGGEAGARRMIDILRQEVDLSLALIGCPDIAALGPHFLLHPPDPHPWDWNAPDEAGLRTGVTGSLLKAQPA